MVNGNLPDGWELTTVNEIAEYIRGVSYKKGDASETPKDGFLPILRATNIQADRLITNEDLVFVPEKYVKPEQFLKVGDVVVCMSSGSKHLVGKTAQLEHEWQGSFGTFCGGFRFKPTVNLKFGAYYFQSPSYREFIRKKSSGININNLRFADFESLEIPLPSLPEQERIVSRIEELFSDLEAGVAALERVRAGLKRYKASVLKAACEGKLLKDESGRMKDEGELPEGWRWATLESIALKRKHAISSGPFGSALGTKDYRESGVPVLRGQNIKSGKFNLNNLVYISEEKAQEIIRSTAVPGDLVVVAVGSSGQPAIVPDTLPRAILSQNCNKITLDADVALGKYILNVMQTSFAQDQLLEKTTDTARPFLSLTNLKKTIIPLPPLEEQRRIVAEVERRLSVVGEVESAVEVGLARASRLRQAVLRSAFEGNLS
jgi:type I restriction enzyme, S subunit